MENKPRKIWIAALLTFLTIGLGHIYSGKLKKGSFFYLGQYLVLVLCMTVVYLLPSFITLIGALLFGSAYFLYCLIDAIRIAQKARPVYQIKSFNRWYLYLGIVICTSLVIQPIISNSIKEYMIQAYKIPAGSLKPTLLVGDQILCKKGLALKNGLQKGEMIIFPYPEDPSKEYIKRVIAVGGDEIEIKNKKVFINRDQIEEPYVIHLDSRILPGNLSTRDNLRTVEVPEDSVFVMGDNRDNSHDSRFWGFVKKPSVTGKAFIIYWSWDRENSKIRWDRIGKTIN
ncbi:signal peptidase I [Desulfospira joergensenii]|uniref:signal peptidase I n=1 Tax=Desulfospira joergensenii TaxID=53329 RepID=UPI0003B476AF|nr:signal peptidase I [Desulfospira joergensenii]